MNALSPNSYYLPPKKEQPKPLKKPICNIGHDKEYKLSKEWPRRYHKYLNNRDKQNIYGTDIADQSNANIVGLEVLPLNTQQQEFVDTFDGRNEKFIKEDIDDGYFED